MQHITFLQDLAATSVKKDRESGQNALALLSHFAKGAREHLLGLPPIMPPMQIPSKFLKARLFSYFPSTS